MQTLSSFIALIDVILVNAFIPMRNMRLWFTIELLQYNNDENARKNILLNAITIITIHTYYYHYIIWAMGSIYNIILYKWRNI